MSDYHTQYPQSNTPPAELEHGREQARQLAAEFGDLTYECTTCNASGTFEEMERHQCATAGRLDITALLDNSYTLDGQEIDIIEFIVTNIDDITTEQTQQIAKMRVDDVLIFGDGGAVGVFELRRTA